MGGRGGSSGGVSQSFTRGRDYYEKQADGSYKHSIAPLSTAEINKQFSANKGQYGSYAADDITGRQASYERFGDTYTVTTWRPRTDSAGNIMEHSKEYSSAAEARKAATEFMQTGAINRNGGK
jgi:hypothetical protein